MTTIIILNWNGLHDTRICLKSLLKITEKNIKIIIIDNGSIKNEARDIEKEFGEKVIVFRIKNNLGFTGGVNYGLEKAKELFDPKFYLLLNNDTIVSKNFLQNLTNRAKSSKKVGLVSPVIYDLLNKSRILFSGGGFNWMLGKTYHKVDKPEANNSQEFLTGCCLLIKREVIEKVGLLDNQFFAYFEDAAYSLVARKNGFTCICEPKSIIYHKESSSLGKKSKVYIYLFSRNRILFINKYTNIIYRLYFFIFNLAKLIIVLIYFNFNKNGDLARAYLKGYVDGIKGVGGGPNL